MTSPLSQSTEPSRRIRLAGTRNLRDVGGYLTGDGRRTRWRTLLRTDALDQLPPASQAELLELGVRQVIDLRWPDEADRWPSVFRSSRDVTYTNIPLLVDDPTPYAGLAGTYRHILDARAGQLAVVARALVADGGLPAVIGCAAGKDRTGVTIAMLLAAVDVPVDTIVADFVLTAEAFSEPVNDAHLRDWRSEPVELECSPDLMVGALEHLETRHGGARALLAGAGLTEAELERLRDRLTEPISTDS